MKRYVTTTLNALALSACLTATAYASPFVLVAGAPKTLTPAALADAQKTETPGQVSPDKKTLTFTQNAIHLVVVTGPEDDMLSYRIGGLRSPALAVPAGATLTVLFVNTDDDMDHDIRFGPILKSYPNVMEGYRKSSVGAPPLPHQSGGTFHAQEMTLRAPATAGAYAYLCTMRGHAQGGMVGTVTVR